MDGDPLPGTRARYFSLLAAVPERLRETWGRRVRVCGL